MIFGKKQQTKARDEIFIDRLPLSPDVRNEVFFAQNRINANLYPNNDIGKTQRIQDFQMIKDATTIGLSAIDGSNKKNFSMVSGRESPGYAPAGSILRKLYPNEFTLQSFLAEAYWAYVKSRKELWVETHRDSYVLVASTSVSKKTIKQINQVLEDLKVPYYRNKLRDNLLVFGNVVMDNKYNKFGGLLGLNPLLMEKVQVKYDRNSDQLLGWEYTVGNKPLFYPYDSVDHVMTYNARSNVLGACSCSSVIVDIEAALQAAIYNNNLMQRGGLLKVLVGMKDPAYGNIVNDKVQMSLADEFQKWLEKKFSGVRGAGQIAFVPMLESVNILNKISEMDSAWNNLDDKTASKTALLLGLYPERIGLVRTSQYENKVLVTNDLALSFDNNNYYVTELVDEYLTRVIIKEGLGIDNVRIQMSGHFKAQSKTAAEMGKIISELGTEVMTVDQFLTDLCHLDAIGGDLGAKYLGDVTRKAAMAKATQGPQNSQADLDLTRVLGQGKHMVTTYQEVERSFVRHDRQNIHFY